MESFLCDAVFTGRLLQTDYHTSFVWELQKGDMMPGLLPYLALGVWRISWNSLMCRVITGLGCVFTLVQMKLSEIKKIP